MGRTKTSSGSKSSPVRTPPAKKKQPQRSAAKTPPQDKDEVSPNNRSKCHKCGIKITKGERRFGIVELNDYGRTQRYYHPACLKDPKLLARAQEGDLAAELRNLRSLFAVELGVEDEPFRIFKNKSLDELVAKQPTTHAELVQIWGIKEKKAQSFGDAILDVIKQYKRKRAFRDNSDKSDDDDSSNIALEETLTCEEIVRRKFEDAKTNGYMISIDDD